MNTKSRTKSKTKFAHLSPEDRQKIIHLCDQHTYHEVLEILPKPRPEGLQLQTSYSALCRFYVSYNEDARKTHLLGQCASTVQIRRQAANGAFRGAILALLESRVFEALRRGITVAELKDEFAVLKDFHKGFLTEEKWRTEAGSTARSDWDHHRSTHLHDQHYDFLPVDPHGRPTEIPPLSDDEILELSQLDQDPAQARAAAIAELDQSIASCGPDSAEQTALDLDLPKSLLKQRIEAHKQHLRSHGLTALQAALEARAAALQPPAPHPNKSTSTPHSTPSNPP